ncbi:pyruvate formate-lyase activating enzyme [Psychromonas sp. CNPT3]|uniref:YjjW family glycine radical enzyme activase n=1 Tax=Psychromonas sp. CNPT3 TaxID=314282 RepID=UPI00006E709B|nr:YjjW family glycine radical enzyme activase [Psychromonas sp. CNPT3]AGH80049.1 pyruvate formate-lyase activating enzyme [Psychromonas sp. CNPT3]
MINFEKTALIHKIIYFSCVDGPGNRAVIFLQGCNYQCKTCHNPQTINICDHCALCVAPCPAQALTVVSGKVVWDSQLCIGCDNCIDICPTQSSPKVRRHSVRQLLERLKEKQMFLSGVTLSGGESTLQLPFIIELFKAIKSCPELSHLTCFIDSNGSLSAQGWDRVMPYLDGAMIDLKAWQNETHLWLVGRQNHRVFKSIAQLDKAGKLYEVRLLHIPNKTDLLTEIESLARYLKQLSKGVMIRINAFQHSGVVGEALTWDCATQQQVQDFQQQLELYTGRDVCIPCL